MNFQWREGYHAPSGLDVDAVGEAVMAAKDPDTLLDHSRSSNHVLYNRYWVDHDDDFWAMKAKREDARQIIGAVHRVWSIGGATITTRAVEFVRNNGDGQWASMDEIIRSKKLQSRYVEEIKDLQQQALDKMTTFGKLLAAGRGKARHLRARHVRARQG